MKKTLLLVTVLLLLVSVVLLVSCDNDSNTTEATKNTDAVSSVQETTPFSTAPTTTEAQMTTTMEQTTAATEPPAPVTRDPGKEYYLDVQSIKVNKNNEDADYIIVNTAGANLNERFADNNGYILYWFNLSDLIEGYVVLHIRQNYLVYATQDIDADYADMDLIGNFNDIADQFPPEGFNENGTYVAGSNKTELVIDPAELGYVGEFYVYIMDCNPADGWGGTIDQIDICSYKEGTGPQTTVLDDSQGTPNYPSADMVETAVSVAVNGYGEDEEYLFREDVREKAITARSAHKRPRRSGCRMPRYTAKELREMNGPTYTVNLGKPIAYKEFKALSESLQKEYLKDIFAKYNVAVFNTSG